MWDTLPSIPWLRSCTVCIESSNPMLNLILPTTTTKKQQQQPKKP